MKPSVLQSKCKEAEMVCSQLIIDMTVGEIMSETAEDLTINTTQKTASEQEFITHKYEQDNSEPLTTMTDILLEGRRMVYIQYLIDSIKQISRHEPFDCTFSDMNIINEQLCGRWSLVKTFLQNQIQFAVTRGYRTKKVLFIGMRNEYCTVCARSSATDAKNTVASHKYAKNWSGSSASMEQDVIIEGFLQNIGMHGLVYCPQMATAQHQTGSYELHSALKDRIMRLSTAVISEDKYYLSSEELRKDILNSPFHVFGDHSKCSERQYFCDGLPKPREVNLVQRAASNASSLILDVDNNMAENYNSVVAKFVGGKRIKCEAAVICQLREQIEERTREQNSSHEWKVERSKCITSSFFGKICKMKATTSCANDARKLGTKSSSEILVQIGASKKSQWRLLRASPDGFIGDDQIIKVNCPSSAISMPPLYALAKGKIKYLEMKDEKPQLKLSHNYMYKVQGVLHISRQKTCNSVIWTPEVGRMIQRASKTVHFLSFPPPPPSTDNAPFRLRPPDPLATCAAERCPEKMYYEVPLNGNSF
ncbi:hypothetical protein PR048_021541 [Dryococelus australis]|uniref:Mutator-like transposase domain-containing protein n=1 Tax=Dryococelus australis TaxID=614101 RepID=A0ABQ9GYH2_9NEOP|nr:hypothetical protein PR048_021541 [Dryococelus australis]